MDVMGRYDTLEDVKHMSNKHQMSQNIMGYQKMLQRDFTKLLWYTDVL